MFLDGLKVWQKKAEIVDSRDSVVDIKVAPPHEGLRIATCSADGQVRIYDALDTSNLAHWSLASSFESNGGKGELKLAQFLMQLKKNSGSNCISWNPSHGEPPMIVEGNVDGIATVWEHKPNGSWEVVYKLVGHKGEILDVSWAPNLGRWVPRFVFILFYFIFSYLLIIYKGTATSSQRPQEIARCVCGAFPLDYPQQNLMRMKWRFSLTSLLYGKSSGTC